MNEHNIHRIDDELSAFLDGEAADPDAVARSIATNTGALNQFSVLQRMSTELKSLSAPTVHPDFEARVMAQVRREELMQARRRGRWARAGAWGAAAAACVGIAAATLMNAPRENTPRYEGKAAQVLELRDALDHALLAEWNSESDEAVLTGDWIDPEGELPEYASNGSVDQSYADVVATFAALATEDLEYEDDGDVYAAMEDLTDEERNVLRTLLTDYAEGSSQLL